MITLKREGTKVRLEFDSGLKIERNVFIFEWECGQEYAAELLTKQLTDNMHGRIEKIRREAYEKGFEDHKKRQPKEEWFSKWW